MTPTSKVSLAVVVLGLTLQPWIFATKAYAAHAAPKLTLDDGPLNRQTSAPISFAPIIQKVAPCVVNIYSTMVVKEKPSPLMDDPVLRRFFGDDSGERTSPREFKAQSLGSGTVISPDGYILTAFHVVEGAETIKVAFSSGAREFEAKMVGSDPPTDVAVLKIDAKTNLPALALGNSDRLQVGDLVLALGNPFGVGQTVTSGIVSGLSRGGFGITGYEDFIQTDAAINPGNSGGALVDAAGRLIGINTAILSRSGGSMGVGFAVPINLARFVMDRLLESGKVSRGFLGINIQPLTPELTKEFHLPGEMTGVLVGGVTANSPARKGGLREGDVILKVNDKQVSDPRGLQLLVAQTPPGSKVLLRVLRGEPNGKLAERTVACTLGELPQDASSVRNQKSDAGRDHQNMDALDGVEVAEIANATRHKLDIPGDLQGALVVNMDQGSSASEAGLRPGDVIVEMNHQPVRGAEDAVALSAKAKSLDHVLLRVWSHGAEGPAGTRYIVVENPARK